MPDEIVPSDEVAEFSARLEAQFREVHARAMADLPICNPALSVACVGFRRWGNSALGVVVTPWSMNVILAPLPGGAPVVGDKGASHVIDLPCGLVDFLVGDLPGLGRAHMCSLFSPMQQFADQETAVATARAALEGLLDENYLTGGPPASAPAEPPRPQAAELDRRAFFRGGLAGLTERSP